MLVSVIFAACNQGDWVRTTLPLVTESLGPIPHEIIVVDDQSVDGCCHGLGQDCLVVRTERRMGISASRRIAAVKAQGDVLLFSDPHCEYPNGALQRLVRLAEANRAIFQPPTANQPRSSRVAYGGRLETSERGIVVRRSPDRAQPWPALINTIYALRKDVYESMGGWPELPGCWGYSEQAMTLLAWSCQVPIVVADTEVCTHYNYQENRRFPYRVDSREPATNAHYVHAAFFPEWYQLYWRERLDQHFGRADECRAALKERAFRKLARHVHHHAVMRDEYQIIQHIGGMNTMLPSGPRDETLIAQQRERAKVKSLSPSGRLRKAYEWFRDVIPGCYRGRAVLDVGARDGSGCRVLKEMDARRIEGVELVPEVAASARRRGHPVREGDMRHLGDLDRSWDLVTCVHALEHVAEPEAAIAEMVRVLRDGGWLLIVVPREAEPNKEWAHNSAFPDSRALRRMVQRNPHIIPETIRVNVVSYAKDKLEIRLAVQKQKQGET